MSICSLYSVESKHYSAPTCSELGP
uniref:Uncharacterized protein n=1 Tax=Anguilla anguilla TaxID=7936 RepID=A0A0E9VSW8_ANGAN